jgi:hypothetical protein
MHKSFLVTYSVVHPFRSSYDVSVRRLAGHAYTGLICPKGHRLKRRIYRRSGWHCDQCETDLEAGSSGKWCQVTTAYNTMELMFYSISWQICEFDLCENCCVSKEV